MEELEKKLRKLYDDFIAFSKILKSIEECEEEESDLVKDINILIKEIENYYEVMYGRTIKEKEVK